MYETNKTLGLGQNAQRSGPSTADDPRPQGEIAIQAQILENRITELAISLDTLTYTLRSILYTEGKAPQNEGITSGPRDTEMAQFLYMKNDALEQLIAQVRSLTDRVAL